MKILFPFVGDSVGGSHLSTLELYKVLNDNGYEALVILHNKNGPLASILKSNDIEFIEFKTKFLAGKSPNIAIIFFSIIWNIFPLAKFIRINNIDIVHGNDLRINLTWSVATIFSQAKFIWHQRTILSTSRLWRFIPFLSNHFIGISKSVINSAPQNIRPSNISLVYNAVNSNLRHNAYLSRKSIIEEYEMSSDAIILGYVGRLVSYKNVDFLIRCVSVLIKIHKKNIYLLIVGAGTEVYVKHLSQLVQELELEAHVGFTGFVSNPSEYISGLDLLMASSSVDAFGRTIVEAMIQLTPVLAADKGGHLEIIEDGKNGVLYNSNIEDSFIEKALGLINDQSLRDSLCETALHTSQEAYSRQKHFSSVAKIYKSLKHD